MPVANIHLGGGLKYFSFSPRNLGKIPILTSIFFRWVDTTNQISTNLMFEMWKSAMVKVKKLQTKKSGCVFWDPGRYKCPLSISRDLKSLVETGDPKEPCEKEESNLSNL